MNRFESQDQRMCPRCGVEPVSILGGVCSPCSAKQFEEDRALRAREVAALERIAAALESGGAPAAEIDAEKLPGNVLAYERMAARLGARTATGGVWSSSARTRNGMSPARGGG